MITKVKRELKQVTIKKLYFFFYGDSLSDYNTALETDALGLKRYFTNDNLTVHTCQAPDQ